MGDEFPAAPAQLRPPARGPLGSPRLRLQKIQAGAPRRRGAGMSATELFTDERAIRGTSSPVMGMVLFVSGESMFFAALFAAYFSIRAGAKVWPPAKLGTPELPIPAVLTATLVTSSVVLQFGVRAIRRGRVAAFERLLG